MKYIHSANVLHRDMKPSNLLVNANCDLAICDFGLARGVEDGVQEELTEYVVTRWYRAPELLADCQNYGDAVDVWALGCIFAEMLGRKPFFQGRDPTHQLYCIINVLGSPKEEEMAFITHESAKKAIRDMGFREKVNATHVCTALHRFHRVLVRDPSANISQSAVRPLWIFWTGCWYSTLQIALLLRRLSITPFWRSCITRFVVSCLWNHTIPTAGTYSGPPMLTLLNSLLQCDEPISSGLFNFDFEREALNSGVDIPKEELQELVYK